MAAQNTLLAAYGGDVITLDPARPRATALLALGDRLLACGDDGEVRGLYDQLKGLRGIVAADPIPLRGRAVIPGLIDSHLHMGLYGAFLQQVDLNGVGSIDELKAPIGDRAAQTPAGKWIIGAGWQQDALAEKRMPTKHDLDAVTPANPAMFYRVCFHLVAVNTLALQAAGITADTPDPPGGTIDRDPATGEPTGILREKAVDLVTRQIPELTPDELLENLRLAVRRASAAGLTSVHSNDDNGAAAVRGYVALRDAGELTVRTYLDTTWTPHDESALALPPGLGDEWIRIGSVKIFSDGSLGGRTALLREPYSDDPATRGLALYTKDQLDSAVWKAHHAGRQVAIHAIGDGAVAMTLDAVEAALRRSPRADHRHRIIHAQVVAADLIPRLRDLGMVIDIQPKFVTGELQWAPDRLGPERVPYSYCWRTLLESGVRCAGSSDCPVEPIEPLLGIYAAVTRSGMDGEPRDGWLPTERLDPLTALKLFTLDAAYGAFGENEKGSLEPGKLADFVVLDRALDKVPPHEIKDLQVETTVAGGKIVYQA